MLSKINLKPTAFIDLALLTLLNGIGFIWFNVGIILENIYLQEFLNFFINSGIPLFLFLLISQYRQALKKSFQPLRQEDEFRLQCFFRIFFLICLTILIGRLLSGMSLDILRHIDEISYNPYPIPPEQKQNPYILLISLPLVAFFEELTFRGAIRIILERHIKNVYLVTFISSIFFGLAHYYASLPNMVSAFCYGLVLMALYYRTKSLIPPMIAHYFINFLVYY